MRTRAWQMIRWVVGVGIVAWIVRFAVEILRGQPGAHDVPFHAWYGNWREVAVATGFFLVFLLGFARPRRRGEWRSAGLYSAFLISLFTEMFGIPLTIYLLAPLLGLPASAFGMNESHLWAFTLDRLGLLPLPEGVHLVMVISIVLIAAGLSLLALGWVTVYRGRGRLVHEGIYRWLRHPQYLGLMLIVLGFNVMWPTILTLAMAPVLVVMYARLARREDGELAATFGQAFADYATRTPAFLPWTRPGPAHVSRAGRGSGRREANGTPAPEEARR